MKTEEKKEEESGKAAEDQQHVNSVQHGDGTGQMGSHQIGDFQMTAEEKEVEQKD